MNLKLVYIILKLFIPINDTVFSQRDFLMNFQITGMMEWQEKNIISMGPIITLHPQNSELLKSEIRTFAF